MNEEVIHEAVRNFTENETWETYYDDAPSEICKRHIALTFAFGNTLDPIYAESQKKDIEPKLKKEDWEYLWENEGNNPRKAYYKKMMNNAGVVK